MKALIFRAIVLLIVYTLVAFFAFQAGLHFANHHDKITAYLLLQQDGSSSGLIKTIIASGISLFDYEHIQQNHVRFRREDHQTVITSSTFDNSAIAVDGPIYPNSSTQLLFKVAEKFYFTQQMGGGFFYTPPHDGTFLLKNETTSSAQHVMTGLEKILNTYTVTTSLLHSFSPDVERRVKTMFPDILNENIFYANSPALFWDRDYNNGVGRLVVIMRIWLARERFEEKKNWPQNSFMDNYFYSRTYDNKFKPLDPGQIMGIPTNARFSIGDGPIEPRIFPAFSRSSLFVSFNAGMTGLKNKRKDYTLIWDFRDNRVFYPVINGYSPMLDHSVKSFPRDKHWSAFNQRPPKSRQNESSDVIHFVHNLDPLRILECTTNFQCGLIYAAGTANENVFVDSKHHLRGGTPFVHYVGNYYISFGHVTLFKKRTSETRRYYTTNIVLLRADPDASPPYRIVFISEPLKINERILHSVPIVRYMYIEDPFIFPVGLLLENRDTAVLGVHVNDNTAVLIRIRGLEPLLAEAIAADKLPPETWDRSNVNNQRSSEHKFLKDDEMIGPNRFTRFLAEEESGTKFRVTYPD